MSTCFKTGARKNRMNLILGLDIQRGRFRLLFPYFRFERKEAPGEGFELLLNDP
jgi:hypothetical protein